MNDDNLEKLYSIANSPAGKELLDYVKKNNSPQMNEAMKKAEAGDFSQAKEMLEKLLSSPEGANIMRKIRGQK